MLSRAAGGGYSERVYQVFGKETLDQLIAVAAMQPLDRAGLPQPPPWRRTDKDEAPRDPGEMRLHGFVSKPEIQKLNRNSIYVFVNGRLIRDRLVQHAILEAYRNILPPTVFPVVLLFLELPSGEVDVNVHPSKTEVRFRQQTVMHDFVRDSVRAALMKARPVPQFTTEVNAHPTAGPWLTREARATAAGWQALYAPAETREFSLQAPVPPAFPEQIRFEGAIPVEASAAIPVAHLPQHFFPTDGCMPPLAEEPEAPEDLAPLLASLKPLGQIRESFILAVNHEGLWIIDQHVAHERVLFEKSIEAARGAESRKPAPADAAAY